MTKSHLGILLFLGFLLSCNEATMPNQFDLQGHRGCRGLMPENTIPAFLKAVDLGVTTLEMDLAVTKDHQLLVSHEPYFSSECCLNPAGEVIPDSVQMDYNIYTMSLEEIQQFDCGSKPHPRFPEQEKFHVTKPLLSQVILEVEQYTKEKELAPVAYNIEVKSVETGDNEYHPTPKVFGDLVFDELNGTIDWSRITVQSFDFRVLQYFHETYPDVTLAVLIENKQSVEGNLTDLGVEPKIYICDYTLLSRENVKYLHDMGIKVIPWTVNEIADMRRLIDWGVDGLITDYPNRYKQITNE
jgi:glycerophosphoryl diester phosphodiesterase